MPSSEPADFAAARGPRPGIDYAEPEPASDSEERFDDAEPKPRPRTGRRLLGVAYSLLQIHVEIAQREVERDQQRLARGLLFMALAVFLLFLTLIVAQALGVGLLHAVGLSWTWSLAGVAGADLIFCLLLFWLGRRALRAPVLPETRALLRRTATALLDL